MRERSLRNPSAGGHLQTWKTQRKQEQRPKDSEQKRLNQQGEPNNDYETFWPKRNPMVSCGFDAGGGEPDGTAGCDTEGEAKRGVVSGG